LKFELGTVLAEGTKWVHSPKFGDKCLGFAVPQLELGISTWNLNWKLYRLTCTFLAGAILLDSSANVLKTFLEDGSRTVAAAAFRNISSFVMA
jgi:hypothetical protein